MTQNIYDNDEFFAGYSRLGRSVHGLDGAAEWPALRAMLPDMRDLAVVDLGCGFGWFCQWARAHGAIRVLGLDVSENMLERARTTTSDVAITYTRADLENFTLRTASFDLAYSSLTLHYLEDLDRVLDTVRGALVSGGRFVFSVEHPIYTAPMHPGWVVDTTGRKTWPVDSYSVEGPRETDWMTKGVIKQHRTIGHYLNALLRHGFGISHVEEWGPLDEQIVGRPELAAERQRPPFLLVGANPRADSLHHAWVLRRPTATTGRDQQRTDGPVDRAPHPGRPRRSPRTDAYRAKKQAFTVAKANNVASRDFLNPAADRTLRPTVH